MIVTNSKLALRALWLFYHLISNTGSWNNCYIFISIICKPSRFIACYFLTINGPFKRSHCHMLCEFSNIISCRFVACYNIGTPCSILMYVCLSNSELSGAFPDNLRKMTRASLLIIWKSKVVSRPADLLVPIEDNSVLEKMKSK